MPRSFKAKLLIFTIIALTGYFVIVFADSAGSVHDYRRANEHRILQEFVSLLSIPNVASDRDNIRKTLQ
jgi:hypothetical protein